jgi:hypothetical protein
MANPRGSGIFATIFGVVFLVVAVASLSPRVHLRAVCPYTLLKVWLFFGAVTLLAWGINRTAKGSADYTVGQSTINFVVGFIGATIAIFTLVVQGSPCL